MLEESGDRRTPRDWVVDALMYICSIGFGAAILGSTVSVRSEAALALDVACGAVAFAALWFRRRQPMAVAVVVIALAGFSALSAAAALAACFNAALRMQPRPLAGVAALAFAGVAASAAFYGNDHGYDWTGLLVGVLLTVIVLGWGLFARAQRDLVGVLREDEGAPAGMGGVVDPSRATEPPRRCWPSPQRRRGPRANARASSLTHRRSSC